MAENTPDLSSRQNLLTDARQNSRRNRAVTPEFSAFIDIKTLIEIPAQHYLNEMRITGSPEGVICLSAYDAENEHWLMTGTHLQAVLENGLGIQAVGNIAPFQLILHFTLAALPSAHQPPADAGMIVKEVVLDVQCADAASFDQVLQDDRPNADGSLPTSPLPLFYPPDNAAGQPLLPAGPNRTPYFGRKIQTRPADKETVMDNKATSKDREQIWLSLIAGGIALGNTTRSHAAEILYYQQFFNNAPSSGYSAEIRDIHLEFAPESQACLAFKAGSQRLGKQLHALTDQGQADFLLTGFTSFALTPEERLGKSLLENTNQADGPDKNSVLANPDTEA